MRKIVLLIILLVIVILAIWFFNIPQKIGLAKAPEEKLLSATPDRAAAAAMMADIEAAGADTSGLDLYVFPMQAEEEGDEAGNYAVAILDASEGFDIKNFSGAALTDYLEKLAEADSQGDYDIERVAIAYRGEDGEMLMTFTAPTEAILNFADGATSQEQFLENLEGEVNFVEIAGILAGEVR